jgi:hypothetical protein
VLWKARLDVWTPPHYRSSVEVTKPKESIHVSS